MMAVQTATTTMQVHDELAALLARNLTLGSVPYSMPVTEAPVAPPAPTPPAQAEQPKIVYSISQHYHHSAHAIKPVVEVQAQPEPQYQQQQQQQQPTAEQVLVQNGIDPTALTDVQLALFKMSAPDRRDYLLQLWRICPPTRPAAAVTTGPWDTIDVEMDREIASSELRVQQSQAQKERKEAEEKAAAEAAAASASAPTQSSDGRWLQSQSQTYMEPYMASGYEELARREYMASAAPSGYGSEASIPRSTPGVQLRYSKATDPVYNNTLSSSLPSRASWPQSHHTAADMENQYGALMAMRDSCDMEM